MDCFVNDTVFNWNLKFSSGSASSFQKEGARDSRSSFVFINNGWTRKNNETELMWQSFFCSLLQGTCFCGHELFLVSVTNTKCVHGGAKHQWQSSPGVHIFSREAKQSVWVWVEPSSETKKAILYTKLSQLSTNGRIEFVIVWSCMEAPSPTSLGKITILEAYATYHG